MTNKEIVERVVVSQACISQQPIIGLVSKNRQTWLEYRYMEENEIIGVAYILLNHILKQGNNAITGPDGQIKFKYESDECREVE